MRILFLTQTTELGPASRYRVHQFLPALRTAGLEYEVSPAILDSEYDSYFGGSRLRKTTFLPRMYRRRRIDAGNYDLVFVQKEFFPLPWPRARGRILYDIDDAVFGRMPSGTVRVFAGNEFLASRFPNSVVMPTVVDTERFRPAKPRLASAATATSAVSVWWIGSRTTNKYVEMIEPALRGFRVKVVSSEPPHFRCEFERWSLEREVEQVLSFDIGLAPLADTEWERGKCGLKVLQYMACGIPVVASPVGVQRDFVERSGGGLLAGT